MSEKIISLTSLRGIAALFVVISHLASQSLYTSQQLLGIGELGVSIFFSLSGFLMGYLYLLKPFDNNSAIQYVISRFSRIAPAYLIVVVASYVIYNFFDPTYTIAITNQNILRHLLFSGNVSVLWSIPPEVQFYAVFFLFWYSIERCRSGKFLLFSLMIFIFILSVSIKDSLPGTFVFSKILSFLLGVYFGYLKSINVYERGCDSVAHIMQWLFIFWGVCLIFTPNSFVDFRMYWRDTYNAIWPAILVFFFSYTNKSLSYVLNFKGFQLLGEWSFSLYLTHVFALHIVSSYLPYNFFGSFLAVIFSLLFSGVFYYLVERKAVNATKKGLASVVKTLR